MHFRQFFLLILHLRPSYAREFFRKMQQINTKEQEHAAIEEATAAAPAMVTEEQIEGALESRPRNVLVLLLRWLLPVALTILLVWYLFSKVDFASMWEIIQEGVDYWWILLAMGISVLSHVSRAARWQLQLRSLGIDAPFMALCCSIFGCYALNLIFPRLGEVWRCTYIAKRQKASFSTVLGSMVSDRFTDSLAVLTLLLIALAIANTAIMAFLEKYPVGQGLLSLLDNPWVWLAGIFGVGCIVTLFYFGRRTRMVGKLTQWLKELWSGVATLWRMRGRGKFLMLTVAIWGCYFLQLYVAFFAFGFTRRLCMESSTFFGLIPCLVAFVFSAIGMAIPSNGGLGPWNIAIMFGLAIYGISDTEGTAFSMVQWSGQTVMLILLGIFTMIYQIGGRKVLKPTGQSGR